jgi:hypothetical protein
MPHSSSALANYRPSFEVLVVAIELIERACLNAWSVKWTAGRTTLCVHGRSCQAAYGMSAERCRNWRETRYWGDIIITFQATKPFIERAIAVI